MATLIVLALPEPGKRCHVTTQGNTVMGRDPTCDLVLDNRSISRLHAHIIAQRGRFYIEDNNSTNGTYINGRRLQSREQLHDGDRIGLNDIPLIFFYSDSVELDPEQTTAAKRPNLSDTHQELEIPAFCDPGPKVIRGRLESLIEIARSFTSSFDLSEILPKVLDLLFCMFPQTSQGEIYLEDENEDLVPVAIKKDREADSADLSVETFNEDVVHEVFTSGKGLIRNEGTQNPSALSEITSVLSVPIIGHEGKISGAILLESIDANNAYNNADLDLVSAVAVLAGQAIGYSRAHNIVVRHAKTERQMETARMLQISSLPDERPDVLGIQFAEYYSAAEQVGGDYFFYEPLQDGRVVVGIADASGKGLPAAMNIARFGAEVRLRIATLPSLADAMTRVNWFVSRGESTAFITCCICVIDPQLNTITVVNAGHMPPICRNTETNTIRQLTSRVGSLPLGIMATDDYQPDVFELAPGDQILMYTDGVSEAMNSSREILGIPRLLKMLDDAPPTIGATVQHVVKQVADFSNNAPQSDDLTIVGFQRLAGKR